MFITTRKMKYQREADQEWTDRMCSQPGCERIPSCIQCGTCSGTCPLSIYMDYTPRRIIQLVREGFRDEALSCQTIWLCASCYSCAVLCPQQIKITDLMYSLKRQAIREKKYPARFPAPVLGQEFFKMVRQRGRSSETWLILRLALKSNPLILLTMARTGWDLFRTGRLSLKMERIKNTGQLKRLLQPADGRKQGVA